MVKKEQGPQYVMSVLNTPMLNYKVYYMDKREKVMNVLMAFVIGGVVGLAFYGGQFRDSDGISTDATRICDLVLFVLIGAIAACIFIPIRKKQLQDKRRMELTQQFRGFLQSLAVSLSSGMNMSDFLISAHNDLKVEYSDNAYIVAEVHEMISGMQNGVAIEKMLEAFGERSQIDDISNFAAVFEVSYRAGGNLKDIVRRTNDIISEKIEIAEEIETALSSNKSQFTAMMCIPVVMMLLLRMMSSSFAASFATGAGVMAITMAIGIFVAAFKLGQKIMNVRG